MVMLWYFIGRKQIFYKTVTMVLDDSAGTGTNIRGI
jgi:hypothetical protein